LTTNLKLSLNTPEDAPQPPIVDIRYGQIGMVQVRVRTTDPGAILDELTGRIATAPNFFRRTAVCLDLGVLDKAPEVTEVQGLIDAIRRAGMLAVGLASGSPEIEAVSNAVGLPILSGFRPQSYAAAVAPPSQPAAAAAAAPAPEPEPKPEPESEAEPEAEPEREPTAATVNLAPAAQIQNQTVRSGQRIYARNRDLIVTATVGAGSEVIADGCLHIYGALRGRAIAGARGQSAARVFCQEFHAELVSIAGVFRVFETIPAELAGKPVQAWLEDEALHFARVGA
jgi:septum site-determining protein MinC